MHERDGKGSPGDQLTPMDHETALQPEPVPLDSYFSIFLPLGSLLAWKMVWEYRWLVLPCNLFWTRSATQAMDATMSALNVPTSLDFPSGTMVNSLMDFARTLDNGSKLHPMPNLVLNTELDIVFLVGQIDHVDLTSAKDFRCLCLEYVRVTQRISDNLENTLVRVPFMRENAYRRYKRCATTV